MTQFFNDTFTTGSTVDLTAHTSESLHSWVQAKGTISPKVFTAAGGIVANGGGSTEAQVMRPSVIAPTADVSVLSTLHYDSVNFTYVGVVARMASDASSGYLAAYSTAAGKWGLWRMAAGVDATTQTAIAVSTTTSSYVSGNEPVIQLDVTGSGATVTVKLTVDGVVLINFPDTDAARVTAAGYPGLYFLVPLASGNGMWISSLSADTIAAAVAAVVAMKRGRRPRMKR